MSKRKKKRALLMERDALKRERDALTVALEECKRDLECQLDEHIRERQWAECQISKERRETVHTLRQLRRWQLYTVAAWIVALIAAMVRV